VVQSEQGQRRIPATEFHRLPGDEPWLHNELRPGELIEAVEVPAEPDPRGSHYLKVRERVSYEFAVTSAAAVVTVRPEDLQRPAGDGWGGTPAVAAVRG
jgi:xanthine dehydrogenase YagS FAD-binding subunit